MKTTLENLHVTPKVTITKEQYDSLVELATTNSDEIEKRAETLWMEKGVAKIKIDVYFRKQYFGRDDIENHYELTCGPDNVSVFPTDECAKSKIAIAKPTRDKIAKFAADVANDMFYRTVGDRLSRVNELIRMKAKLRNKMQMFFNVTLTGWLLAIALGVLIIAFK